MTKTEYDQYSLIKNERKLTEKNQKFLAMLHARLFNHQYYLPCGCSPKEWQTWIAQLNSKYDEGYKNNSQV